MKSKMINRKNKTTLTILWLLGVFLSCLPLKVKVQALADYTPPQVIVSLGDSFSSGEGIEPFYGQNKELTNKVEYHDWLAHRSENSWPGMLTLPFLKDKMSFYKDKKTHWFFAASSGAETRHLKSEQEKEYNKKTGVFGKISGKKMLPPQLAVFDQVRKEGLQADYVTLTLGGNDAGFGKVLHSVILGSINLDINSVAERINHIWKAFEAKGGIKDSLRQAYQDIWEAAGPQAQIIVAGYPQLLDKANKGISLSEMEIDTVNNAVTLFNNEIKKLVTESSAAGINIHFVDVEPAFKGHGAYAAIPFLNALIPWPHEEDINRWVFPSMYSFHPNRIGAAVYASCVQQKIDELENARLQTFLEGSIWRCEANFRRVAVYYLEFFPGGQVRYSTPDHREYTHADSEYYEALGTYTLTGSGELVILFDGGAYDNGDPWQWRPVIKRTDAGQFIICDPENPAYEEEGKYITDYLPVEERDLTPSNR